LIEVLSQAGGLLQCQPIMNIPILFVLGISATGKSHFAKELKNEMGWMHLEIDCYPKDGIDVHNLRDEWNAFFQQGDAVPLAKTLEARCAKAKATGIVLSFPSNLITFISKGHIDACSKSIKFVFLAGNPKHCLSSFLAREKQTGRGFGENHWHQNNDALYPKLNKEWLQPFVIDVFDAKGNRKTFDQIYQEVMQILKS